MTAEMGTVSVSAAAPEASFSITMPTGWMRRAVASASSASGPALAVGVRVALTSHLLLGVTVRQVYVRQVTLAWEDPERLDPPPPPARGGGAWMGLTVAWRFGGG